MHIKTNYSYHFESPKALTSEIGNIVACLDVQNMERDLPAFLNALGIADHDLPDAADRHENPEEAETLSEVALANLRSFWATEFEFYNAFREIENAKR